MHKKLIIIGTSGLKEVIVDLANKNDYEIVGFLDDTDAIQSILGLPV